jgi:hypothetical protein
VSPLRVHVPPRLRRIRGNLQPADLPLSLRADRHRRSLAADTNYGTNTVRMSDSDSLDQPQPVLRKKPFTNLTASASATTSSPSVDKESSSSTAATSSETVLKHAQDTNVNMLATQAPSAIGGHGHMFQGCGTGKHPAVVQGELQQLKSSPMLNPHYRMVQR